MPCRLNMVAVVDNTVQVLEGGSSAGPEETDLESELDELKRQKNIFSLLLAC